MKITVLAAIHVYTCISGACYGECGWIHVLVDAAMVTLSPPLPREQLLTRSSATPLICYMYSLIEEQNLYSSHPL